MDLPIEVNTNIQYFLRFTLRKYQIFEEICLSRLDITHNVYVYCNKVLHILNAFFSEFESTEAYFGTEMECIAQTLTEGACLADGGPQWAAFQLHRVHPQMPVPSPRVALNQRWV